MAEKRTKIIIITQGYARLTILILREKRQLPDNWRDAYELHKFIKFSVVSYKKCQISWLALHLASRLYCIVI